MPPSTGSSTQRAPSKPARILAHKHVIPEPGARKLRELSADDVDQWLARKAG
ncbi:hypothetical protein [Actinomadura graeca]|uniref:hypothetical protein n=1 Tax=Actinomadura graeca TaxID=2750812 RepID=UPI001E3BDE37|nr:hypothetical protein [Actinomadura graeca]